MAVGNLPAHSPLGASGAHRWMVCPGSVGLSNGVADEESEYAAEGTAAHSLAEECLRLQEEPWTYIDKVSYGDFTVDKEMADCVQDYILEIDQWHPDRNQGNSWIERSFHCPDIHKYFYGTADFVYWDFERRTLHVWDYKHGAGIVIDAENNPQAMYYAAGACEDLQIWDEVEDIVVHIFQPRGFHWKGPHRTWELAADQLDAWLTETLVPAMDRALLSRDTISGEHCRFCPARNTQCPSLMADIYEYQELLMKLDAMKPEDPWTPEQIGRVLELQEIAKVVTKVASKKAHGMLSTGNEVPGCKLVPSRTNRELKKGAEAAAIKKFGKKRAFTEPELKSPNQLEAMPGGKEFCARWAFKPEGKTTVALDSDPRKAIKRDVRKLFKPVRKKGSK